MAVNVASDLAELAATRGWSARPAFYEGDVVWTHGQVHDLAARLATRLVCEGVRPGETVLIALPDSIGFVVSFLAVARVGAIAVTVNPDLPTADHHNLAGDCDPSLVISAGEIADRFGGAEVDDLIRAAEDAEPAAARKVDPDTTLYVQYTSGTTGQAKGVLHRHADFPLYERDAARVALRIEPTDVGLSVSRMYFAYGLGNSLIYPLYSGSATVLTARRPSAARVRELVQRHQVSLLYTVPSALTYLVADWDGGTVRSLRACVSAGETLAPSLAERATSCLSVPVLDGLGSTEIGGFCCINRLDRQVPGTVGWPLPEYDLQVRDDDDSVLTQDVPGQLWVRGPTVTRGYLRQPEQTARILAGGWLRTGDRAIRHADGTFQMAGRTDDLEMVGGITVSAVEIECVLAEHPAVREVAVASVPDDCGASKLRAFVVPTSGEVDADVLASELIALARARLAAFKVPRTVRLVVRLPRTPTGKIRRFAVRDGSW
jgi:fatty acid CoA ligase FadD22